MKKISFLILTLSALGIIFFFLKEFVKKTTCLILPSGEQCYKLKLFSPYYPLANGLFIGFFIFIVLTIILVYVLSETKGKRRSNIVQN